MLFPSPIGELHFSIESWEMADHMDDLFPSPIGELHFSIGFSVVDGDMKIVSVPYRGATFLNPLSLSDDNISHMKVSVPYRGATFLNQYTEQHPTKKGRFPSPIGELHFSIPFPQCNASLDCFRPLSGSYISQSLQNFQN